MRTIITGLTVMMLLSSCIGDEDVNMKMKMLT